MKSAYELAMERLEKKAPSVALNAKQKREIAEIESVFKARIAERELFLREQIAKAQSAGEFDEIGKIERQLADDVRRLRAECEERRRRREGKGD